MSELNRLFLALVISMAVIFGWNYYFGKKPPMPSLANKTTAPAKTESALKSNLEVTDNAAEQQNIKSDKDTQNEPQPAEKIQQQLKNYAEIKDRTEIISEGFKSNTRVKITTPLLHGSINLVGGLLDDITLATYHQTMDDKSPEVILLSPRNTKDLYFLNTGWVSAAAKLPDDNSLWKVESESRELTPQTPVTISFDNGAGQIFRKIFSIDDRYMISVKQEIENRSAEEITAAPFGLINRTWDVTQNVVYVSHEGPLAVSGGQLKDARYKEMVKKPAQSFTAAPGWIGIGDKYWLTSIIPQESSKGSYDINFKYYKKAETDRFQNDILGTPINVKSQSTSDFTFNIYTGAKKLDYLEAYKKQYDIPLFERSIDFGALYFLTKPIFKTLTFFHSKLGNMGLAIMLLTVCIRLILFPLANASYKSMARMKKHQPEINKLREKSKGDRQKQGTEMMKYYREHKINPAAGCAPILIQIPVFFSLYKVLNVTIEMRHSPFFWFVKDLSAMDPTNVFTLFGLISWDVPSLLPHIGILPIMFAFTMMIQQKLNPPVADETQKVIMAWLPWIFLFVFSKFAAGLVIYWIWNNTLSIIQQAIISRRIEEDKNE